MIEKNYPLIRKVWEHIQAHPEEHDQDDWGVRDRCGTTMCFAGHAAVISGATPIWEESERGWNMAQVITPEGDFQAVDDYAAAALGLTYGEADDLFYDATSKEDVQEIVEHILATEKT